VVFSGQVWSSQVRPRFPLPYLWFSLALLGRLLRSSVDKSVDKSVSEGDFFRQRWGP
jgi:hypothetical protein